MMSFNGTFQTIYCINLDRRPDRWSRVRKRFEEQGIGEVLRFPAHDGTIVRIPVTWDDVPGAYGCLLSHLEVVQDARRAARPNVFIFEDDVVFDPAWEQKFPRWMAQVPDDWEMILLGGSHWSPPVRISDDVYRATATVATHAYALKETIYDEFIELNDSSTRPVDCNNTILQSKYRCYCAYPSLAWQEDGYSDIAEKYLNFKQVEKR